MTLAEDGARDCAKSEAMPDRERVKAPAKERNKKEKSKRMKEKHPKCHPFWALLRLHYGFFLFLRLCVSASASRVPVNEHSVFFFIGASRPRIPKTRQLQ